MSAILDVKEENGEFEVVGIEEESNEGRIYETFRVHCLNADCSLFGFPVNEKITDRFIDLNPEFRIKQKNVWVIVSRGRN